jgi:hypothetical protein
MNKIITTSELKVNWKLIETKLGIRYKLITSNGWTFIWMNSMVLASMIVGVQNFDSTTHG